MTFMTRPAQMMDGSALTISGLCIIHCLALPVAALWLPLAGAFAEAEWIHKVLVLIALPVSSIAFLGSRTSRTARGCIFLAVAGLSLMLASAFLEALHEAETALTVTGALMVAAAHIWRWRRHARHGHTPAG